MKALLFSVLTAAALPARAADFKPAAPLAELDAASRRVNDGIERLLATPVEKARVPILKAAADDVAGGARGAADAAASIAALAVEPAADVETAMKKTDAPAALAAAASTARERLRKRLHDAKSGLRDLKRAADEERDPAKRVKLDEAVKKAESLADAADASFGELGGRWTPVEEARFKAVSAANRVRGARDELASAARQTGQPAESLPDAASEYKKKLDALDDADPASRTRVYQAAAPLLDLARLHRQKALTVPDRAERMSDALDAVPKARERFRQAHARFEDQRAALEKTLAEFEAVLLAAPS